MSLAKSLQRWTMRSLRTLMLISAVGLPVAVVRGQGPSAPANLPKKTFTKSSVFDLPVQMHDSLRANLQEVRLYVKTATSDWALQEKGPPSLTRFTYRVPQDGEYWFSLATVDKSGKQTPDDVNQEPPCLRVIVDRQLPTLQVTPWTSPDGESCLRCSAQDANIDPAAALRVVAKMPQGDVTLDAMPGQPGVFRLRGAEGASSVRVSAVDLAGNVATHEVSNRELPPAFASGNAHSANRPDSTHFPSPLPRGEATAAPQAAQGPTIINAGAPPAVASIPPTPPPTPVAPPAMPVSEPVQPVASVPAPTNSVGMQMSGDASRGVPTNRQLLNTTRANVEYRIDQVGPSGVGKVEVYVTTDQGQVWQRLSEYPERRSPVEVVLPGEGLYGLRLVITNGNGFGGAPPRRGDAPDVQIEVDTTAPYVQLGEIRPVVGGQLELKWSANDKNLSAEPVSLYYRTQPDGPWQLIAKNVKNDGSYRWPFPRNLGNHFYFKVEVVDQAGNLARVESPTPLVLDMTEPRASVISVSGSTVRPTVGNAN